jgi:glycogen synthase
MRVLMLGWEFPPHNSGGLGVACEGLARAVQDCDTDVLFILPRPVPAGNSHVPLRFALTDKLEVRGVDVALTPYITSHEYARYRGALVGTMYGNSLFEEVLRYAIAIRSIVLSESFDIIHAHDWLSALAGVEAKRLSGKPLIVHVHATGYDLSGGQGIDSRIYAIEKLSFDTADAIIAVSDYTRRMIAEHYGVPLDKIHVVHNGVDPEKCSGGEAVLPLKRHGQKMVLYVGRLALQKGPDYFLRAAARVLPYYQDTYFVISGSGDMEWKMVELASQLGISHKVVFTGFLRGEELNRLFKAADLYVLPSVSEPFGIAPLEALVSGTPVLISKQSGVSEVLSHALKVDFWDIDEMANQMIAVLRYGTLQSQLAREGREEALKLTWRRAAEKCVALYDRVMRNLATAFSA